MMRTSNKLFGIVILLVLALPLLVVAFLLKSVRDKEFIIRDSTSQKIRRGAYTQTYKTLKIVAPDPDHLRCHFFPTDSATMQYTTARPVFEGSMDSVRIYNSGDTLYVEYVEVGPGIKYQGRPENSSGRRYTHMNVNLHLPSFDDIVVDGGYVTLDSLWQPAKFTLANRGTLVLATAGNRTVRRKSVTSGDTGGSVVMVPLDSTYSGDFKKLTVIANNGYLSIGDYAWVRDIELDLRAKSYLGIDTTARIDQIGGTISPEATVGALPGIMRKLTPLITKEDKDQ